MRHDEIAALAGGPGFPGAFDLAEYDLADALRQQEEEAQWAYMERQRFILNPDPGMMADHLENPRGPSIADVCAFVIAEARKRNPAAQQLIDAVGEQVERFAAYR